MTFLDTLERIFQIIIIPLLGLLVPYIIQLIRTKGAEIREKTDNEIMKKYIDMLTETIANCVTAVNQTYVDTLKKQGNFGPDAQKIAFNTAFARVKESLSEEAKVYLSNIFGDLDEYIAQLIEAQVHIQKI